jgi:hypothetical protein
VGWLAVEARKRIVNLPRVAPVALRLAIGKYVWQRETAYLVPRSGHALERAQVSRRGYCIPVPHQVLGNEEGHRFKDAIEPSEFFNELGNDRVQLRHALKGGFCLGETSIPDKLPRLILNLTWS